MQKPAWPNSGRVFKNSNRKSDKSPDQMGDAKITCPGCGEEHEFYVSVWNKQGQRGPWLAFTFKDKPPRQEQQEEQPAEPVQEQQPTTDNAEELPF